MMDSQVDLNATWNTADSSEPVSTRKGNQSDDHSKQLFLDKQCFSVVDCDEKWKLPDSSVMNPPQEVINQGIDSVQIKEEGPDDYTIPEINVPNGQMSVNDLSDLGHNAVSGVMNHDSKFEQVQQELPSLGQELMMPSSYPPRIQPITYQGTSNGSNYCAECGKTFTCNRSFRRHMSVHTGARPFHCKDCGRAFSRKDSLLAHERRHRRKTTHFRYQCQQCGISFLNSFQLKTHEQQHTSPVSASDQNEAQVENAIVTKPQGIAASSPYILPEPTPTTSSYEDMLETMINQAPQVSISSDKKLHRCPFCRKLFTKQYAMNLHMKTHMVMFNCEYCGKVFRFRRNKQIHILKFHHKLQCVHCQKNFPNPDSLRSHQLLHCSSAFNMNEMLSAYSGQNQMKSYDTSDPNMYCKCGSSFLNKTDFQKHTDVCKQQTTSIQSSSGCFYYTSPDGSGRLDSENSLSSGQQTSEVCSMENTIESYDSSEVCNPVLQCNVCTSRLEKPRTLPCTHSFCHDCLENCLDKLKCTLCCPTCQLVVLVPDGDLAHLQANQMISTLLSEVQNSEQQMHPLCIVCDVNASHHCQQCDAFICIKCSAAHLKLPATKDHTQISLTEYNTKDPRERMAAAVVMCKEHDSPSQFFCSSCHKLICVGCTLVDHPKGSEHEITDLSSAFESFCTVTEPMISECEELEKKLSSAMNEIKPILQIEHQIQYKCRESIQAYVAKLRAALDKLQDKLLLEVDELTTAKQMAIDSQLNSLKRELEDVKGTRLLANQLVTSPNKAMALTSTFDVSKHLKDILNKSPPTSNFEAKKVLMFTPCEDLLDVILEKGIGSLKETEESESELKECIIIE
ncbi:zinc finger protein 184-like [Anneissia japonica]|uniref:zinc finger protein 184-like n=1 Tax=Anneissia japonica TaxID=1529436 RepID=UPI0014257B7F|nr:zinc finger protein 184-like [Anneissia japonica]